MLLRDISLSNPEENLLFDDVLLNRAQETHGRDVLRFWESKSTFIVLGKIGKIEEDLQINQVEVDNIPVLRRNSGGGTVVQGMGCLNYSVIIAKSAQKGLDDITKSYRIILGKVVEALNGIGVDCSYRPISDIALNKSELKFSGNAQRRAKDYILHHGTILYNFNLTLISKYLLLPKTMPDYRNARAHEKFVTNINKSAVEIKNSIAKVFGVENQLNHVTASEKKLLADAKK